MNNNNSIKGPFLLHLRSSNRFILTTVGLALFTDLFLYGIIVPLLPFVLTSRLHLPHSEIQSYTSILLGSYALASLLSSVPAGIIADRLNARQIPFTGGLLTLVASTILLASGQKMWVLILARILQGVSGGTVWTVGMALVRDTVGTKNMGEAMGSIFGLVSTGELMAPVLGGVVYEKFGNTAVFGMAFALLGVDIVMRVVMVEKKVALRYKTSADDTESETQSEETETEPLIKKTTTEEDDSKDFVLPETLPWFAPNPFFYILLTEPRLYVAHLVALMQATILSLFDATIPLLVQDLFDFTPQSAGLIFVPLVLPSLLFAPLMGRGVDRYGVKIFGVIGFLYLSITIFLLSYVHAGGQSEITKLALILAATAPGISAIGSPSVVETTAVMEKYWKANPDAFGKEGPFATLYAVGSLMFSGGMAVGPALAGVLRGRIGYGGMNVVVSGLCVLSAGFCFVWLGGKPRILRKKTL